MKNSWNIYGDVCYVDWLFLIENESGGGATRMGTNLYCSASIYPSNCHPFRKQIVYVFAHMLLSTVMFKYACI